jgi:predicted metal-binding membrane protein
MVIFGEVFYWALMRVLFIEGSIKIFWRNNLIIYATKSVLVCLYDKIKDIGLNL